MTRNEGGETGVHGVASLQGEVIVTNVGYDGEAGTYARCVESTPRNHRIGCKMPREISARSAGFSLGPAAICARQLAAIAASAVASQPPRLAPSGTVMRDGLIIFCIWHLSRRHRSSMAVHGK